MSDLKQHFLKQHKVFRQPLCKLEDDFCNTPKKLLRKNFWKKGYLSSERKILANFFMSSNMTDLLIQTFLSYLLLILLPKISALRLRGKKCPWKVRKVTINYDQLGLYSQDCPTGELQPHTPEIITEHEKVFLTTWAVLKLLIVLLLLFISLLIFCKTSSLPGYLQLLTVTEYLQL